MISRPQRLAISCLAGLALIHAGCGGGKKDGAGGQQAQLFPNPPEEAENKGPQSAADSDGVAAGTVIEVVTLDVVDSETSPPGAFVPVRVTSDVKGRDGKVAIPGRSAAIIAVLSGAKVGGDSSMSLALYQITVDNRSYLLVRGSKQLATLDMADSAAKGVGHRSIHLERGSYLKFTLSEAVEFRR